MDGFHSVVSASLNRSSNSTSPRAARSLLLDLSRVHNRDSPSFASEKEYRARRQSTDSPSIAETLIQSLAYANDSSIPSSPSSFNSSLLGGRPPLLEDVGKLDLGHPSTSSSQNLSIRIQELEELQSVYFPRLCHFLMSLSPLLLIIDTDFVSALHIVRYAFCIVAWSVLEYCLYVWVFFDPTFPFLVFLSCLRVSIG